MSTDATLTGERLTKRYGDATVLDDVSVRLRAGESVAVMGPSGSGKSTLLYCLSGVVKPDDGAVVYDGDAIHRASDARRARLRRERFGFVFQFHGLLPELTAVENVAVPIMLDGQPPRGAAQRARALFGRLGLEGLEDRRPGTLSGGQAQRVAVARALVNEPRVLFADEPTGALDTETGAGVVDLLTAQARDHGCAVVIVTHDSRVAARCDRTVTVVDGRVLEPA